MKLIDISLPVTGYLPVWPGDPPVTLQRISSMEAGDECNVTAIAMTAHNGTHLDAPLHFLRGGGGIESIRPDILIGPCRVIELDSCPLIERKDLEERGLRGQERILFKTKNSRLWDRHRGEFRRDYVSLGLDAARYLAEIGIKLVGIDYLSIEAFDSPDHPVHRLLLGRTIAILEGLNLSAVNPGDYELICLPLNIIGSDGAPARALLRET